MEVQNKLKKPLLPRNYVSLAQLQQRRMEEQLREKREEEAEKERQRKQKEAEEEERRWRLEEEAERRRREKDAEEDRKRREKEEAERSRLGQVNQIGGIRNGHRREINVPELSRDRKPPNNRRYRTVKSFGVIGIDESKPVKSEIGVISVDEGARKIEGVNENEKIKKKKKKKKLNKKPRANMELPKNTELISPENEKVDEQFPAELTKRDGGNQSGKTFKTIESGERSSGESQTGAISFDAVKEKKKKNRHKQSKKKLSADKEQSELISPEQEKVNELIPATLAKLDNGKVENGNEFHQNVRTATDAGFCKKVPVMTWVRKEKSKAEEGAFPLVLPEYKKKARGRVMGTNIEGQRKGKRLQVLPEYKKKAEEENIPVGVAEQQEAEMETKMGDQRKGKLLGVVIHNGPRMEKEVDPSSMIEGKLVDLSLNDETRGFKTNAGIPNRHGYKKKSNGDNGKLSNRRAPNSMDSNLVWVKKDDTSNSMVTEVGAEVSEARVQPRKYGRKPYR